MYMYVSVWRIYRREGEGGREGGRESEQERIGNKFHHEFFWVSFTVVFCISNVKLIVFVFSCLFVCKVFSILLCSDFCTSLWQYATLYTLSNEQFC